MRPHKKHAPIPEAELCRALINNGTRRCARRADSGSPFCWRHDTWRQAHYQEKERLRKEAGAPLAALIAEARKQLAQKQILF